jgi:hypothetical protein
MNKSILSVILGATVAFNAYSDTFLHPTIPGTSQRDYFSPSLIIKDDGSIKQTIPGTNHEDYMSGGYKIEGNELKPTIPGTNQTDYFREGFIIE